MIGKLYDKIQKEHLVIFLVFLTAIILFNSFDFGYTGLATQEQCRTIYSCCDAGYGEGRHYYNLDGSCFDGGQCFDSCSGNSITGKGVFENFRLFFSDFFSAFKSDVRGAGGAVPRMNYDVDGNGQRIEIDALLGTYPGYRLAVGDKLPLPRNPEGVAGPGIIYEWSTDYVSCEIQYGNPDYLVGKASGDCRVTVRYFNSNSYDPYGYGGSGSYGGGMYEERAEILVEVYHTAASAAKVATNCAEQKGLKLPTHPDYESQRGTGGYANEFQINQLKKIDANSDGVIDLKDFELFCQAYESTEQRFNFYTDDGAATINALDYGQLIYAWGKTIPGAGQQTFSCTGDVFANAVLVSGDDTGLTANGTRMLVDANTTGKCEYACNSGYRKEGNACVLQSQTGGGQGGAGTQQTGYEGFTAGGIILASRAGNNVVLRWPDIFYNPQITDEMLRKIDASGNPDGVIASDDQFGLASAFGSTAAADVQKYDYNGDGRINLGDFRILELSFGRSVPAAPVVVSGEILRMIDAGGNNNKVIDYDDFFAFSAAFGSTDAAMIAKYDFNKDGKIDLADEKFIQDSFNKPIPATGGVIIGLAVKEQESKGFFGKLADFFSQLFGGKAVGLKPSEVAPAQQAYTLYRKIVGGNFNVLADKRLASSLCINGECSYADTLQQAGSYVYKIVTVVSGIEIVSSAKESNAIEYTLGPGVELRHTPVVTSNANQDIRIIALVKNLATVELKYKLASESVYGSVAFTAGQSDSQGFTLYTVVIPAVLVTGNLQYYVVGKDATGSELQKSPANAPTSAHLINVASPPPITEGECNSGVDRDGDGIIAAIDKDCTGTVGKGAIGVKSVGVDDSEPLTGMVVDVSCELNVVGGSLQDVVNGRCVQARIGNSYCENNSVVSGSGLLFNDCSTGFESGKKEVVCFVDRNRCNVDLLQGGNNTQKTLSIELIESDVCEDGVRGKQFAELRNVKLDKSSYGVGERVRVNVDVAATGGKDLEDALVKAVLYDVEDDDKPVTAEAESSESQNVRKGSRKSFTLYLQSGTEDYRHDHSVYVAVETDEPEVCVYVSKDVRFKKSGPNVTLLPPTPTIGPGPTIQQRCVTGQTQPCGSDVGVCRKGLQRCIQGVWGECSGEVRGTREVCGDTLDNDCNGQVDCGDVACSEQIACRGGGDASRDNDQDGLPDYWEQKYFESVDLANGDEDSDRGGVSNLQEYVDGTDPTNASDDLKGGALGTVLLILGILLILAAVGFVVVRYRKNWKKPEKIAIPKKPEAVSSDSVQRMEDYIQNSLKKGYSEQQIKTALAIKGWTKREIEDVFKKFK